MIVYSRILSVYDFRDQSYIANLPHSTTKDLLEQHPQTEMDYAGDAIKRKVDDLKRGRHRGKSGRNIDGECKGKADAKKRHRGRHCRCRRRRLECRRASKVLSRNVMSFIACLLAPDASVRFCNVPLMTECICLICVNVRFQHPLRQMEHFSKRRSSRLPNSNLLLEFQYFEKCLSNSCILLLVFLNHRT